MRCAAEQRGELEHLCRCITRSAIANERLSANHAGQVVLKLKTPYRDGTSHINMSPLEFMQRLAALVPRPRLHLIRFHGVLAPHAKLRATIVPIPAQTPRDSAPFGEKWRLNDYPSDFVLRFDPFLAQDDRRHDQRYHRQH